MQFGFSNPSGLRNKEEIVIGLGTGVWSFSETHLSQITQRSCTARLRHLAAAEGRNLMAHMGAPVATRPNSEWAGTWSGVATITDAPSQVLRLPYGEEYNSGRLLTTCHFFPKTSVTCTVLYGYPHGPTWPRAKQLTESLLEVITTEVVLGGKGPRIVGGDFNTHADGLSCFALWRQLGWQSAQVMAEQLWHQAPRPTCKHATETDLVWLSPEAQALCQYVDISEHFSDHATITVGLELTSNVETLYKWPLPSRIPWHEVDANWHSSIQPPVWAEDVSVDQQWAQLGHTFETSLNGHLPTQPGRRLQKGQQGRLQQTQPVRYAHNRPVLKPSRPSEVALRSDLIGADAKAWFRQLRRLQSYLAAIRAQKMSPAAIAYRLELWTSICRSAGFRHGFPIWWRYYRQHTVPGAPVALPFAPPQLRIAQPIFDAFKLCFEHFESWHLRQRCKLLKAKYDKGMAGIYHDLRRPARDTLDFLTDSEEYTVLAVDADQRQVHVDHPVHHDPSAKWSWDGQSLDVQQTEDSLLSFGTMPALEFGHVLTQHRVRSSCSQIHAELLKYWQHTWCNLANVDAETWTRVQNFFTAYVPHIGFEIAPIELSQWKRALRRFRPTAARGVDGLSHVDLLQMPDIWTLRLLDLLNRIELGESTWPTSILYGMVNLLAKDPGATTLSRFRPVVIFSVIYRNWASIRAKQLMRRLSAHMNCEAYGFRPGHEPAQLWLVLQAQIELALQSNEVLCGLSTDLVRAFNHIPRQHTFQLATHLGVPARVIHPWKEFLSNCSRAFVVRGAHSTPTLSTCGFPEGDALSVFAMLQLNYAWDLYMKAFSPLVRPLSFVDNLSLVATSAGQLAWGYTCLVTFFQLWNLHTDVGKSYCWSTNGRQRKQLAQFPFPCVESATELGGVLSFTRKRFTGRQLPRIASLTARWLQLKHSQAPLALKFAALPAVFWSAGLHGVAGSCMGENHVDHLRVQAMKMLRLNKAGANGKLRLSLTLTPAADPGFWRLVHTVLTFRRLLWKEPSLGTIWQCFMQNFDGSLFSGPCSQIVVVLNQIGWQVSPPNIVDHDGCSYDLLQMDDNMLHGLLYDGWLQHVACSVNHRASMADLTGLDPHLVNLDKTSLTALDAALVGSLQDGAFIGSAIHSKYDVTKQKHCTDCGVPDTPAHWLQCPKYQAEREAIEGWSLGNEDDTGAMQMHLLPSRSPWAVPWKRLLLSLDQTGIDFLSQPGAGLQHVFSDGSSSGTRPFGFAAWGCINASTGGLVSLGHVPGLTQTSDRAELLGALGAIKWQLHFRVDLMLWLDSKFTADGLDFVLMHGFAGSTWANSDLWRCIVDHVHQLDGLTFTPRWIPSHLDERQLECGFEDWVSHWNNQIDRIVGAYNMSRPSPFFDIYHQAVQHHANQAQKLRHLRSFYLAVAAANRARNSSTEISDLVVSPFDFDASVDQPCLQDLYIEDRHSWIHNSGWVQRDIPLAFVGLIFDWMFEHTGDGFDVYPLSFVELVLLYSAMDDAQYPFWNPMSKQVELAFLGHRFERPTLSQLLRVVRKAVAGFLRFHDFGGVLFQTINKVAYGAIKPLDGIFLRLDPAIAQAGQDLMKCFCSHRPLRKACDFARPI